MTVIEMYLLVKGHMCRNKLNWGWLGRVSVGESRSGVRQLIELGLCQLINRQRVPSYSKLRPLGQWVAVLVGERLADVEAGFLEK